jgi:asparagine synthase (glutamine-hydrolysing)
MCGVAGILSHDGSRVEESELQLMAAAIRHRGPDDDGCFVGEGIGLAAVRLAIIDVSAAGHQPMVSSDGRHVLVYNGELYNFRELRRELEDAGRRFQSRTDTEVVLQALEEWGERALERFDGMFAFALWDTQERSLFIARDRFGIKPLYYADAGGRFLFGSEVKALLAAGLPARANPQALTEYFTFQNVFSDHTLFDGVKLLPPGHTLTVSGSRVATRRYWDFVPEPADQVAEDEWVERVRVAFERAVTRQLVSDVPLGSYLSGGMDSASVVSVASRSIPRLMTFTGGFDLSSVSGLELVFDEREDAEQAASFFRTEHYEMVMHAGDMAWILPELVWHLEDLRVGMAYQNHYIARLASKFVTVALAGTGGDELFAGYPWRYELLAGATDRADFDRRCYGYWSRLVPDDDKSSFFTGETWSAVRSHSPFEAYRAVIEPVDELDPVAKALYFEMKTFLHGLLVVEDKVSMAHSLEARVPFLDNDLVDIARRMPSHLKHADGDGKRILRKAMTPLLPAPIVEKKKQGFSPPDESWYRGETMSYISTMLRSSRARERGYFEPLFIDRILNEHASARVNHRLLIWSLLSFEWWNRLFVDREPAGHESPWAAPARRSLFSD